MASHEEELSRADSNTCFAPAKSTIYDPIIDREALGSKPAIASTDIVALLSRLTTILTGRLSERLRSGDGPPILPSATQLACAKESLESATDLPETGSQGVEGREDVVIEHLLRDIGPALPRSSLSSRYYGFVTGGTTPAALAGDILAAVWDQTVQVHLPQESIATTLESIALGWLTNLFRLPEEVWGLHAKKSGGMATFTTGATASNILGLAMGREWVVQKAAMRLHGVDMESMGSIGEHGMLTACTAAGVSRIQVLSTQPHSSLVKAAGVVGIGRSQVVSIAADRLGLTIDFGKLEEQAALSGVASILAISAGEVNTGHFATHGMGDWERIREICNRYDVWIHVDGAFGLFARVLDPTTDQQELGQLMKGAEGVEHADSITGDGHKLLNVPYDCGFYFCRHRTLAEQVFKNGNAAYLTSAAGQADDNIPSPLNLGIENSRRFRALPVYTTLKAYGRQGYRHMLQEQIRLARSIAGWLWDSEGYDLLPDSPQRSREQVLKDIFMIVLFRAKDDQVNGLLVQQIKDTGRIYVSGTTFKGERACRIAVSNWRVNVALDFDVVRSVLEACSRCKT